MVSGIHQYQMSKQFSINQSGRSWNILFSSVCFPDLNSSHEKCVCVHAHMHRLLVAFFRTLASYIYYLGSSMVAVESGFGFTAIESLAVAYRQEQYTG